MHTGAYPDAQHVISAALEALPEDVAVTKAREHEPRVSLDEGPYRSFQISIPRAPGWALRVPALRTGYTHCGGDGAKFDTGSGRRK
jgi:hypothetical protein